MTFARIGAETARRVYPELDWETGGLAIVEDRASAATGRLFRTSGNAMATALFVPAERRGWDTTGAHRRGGDSNTFGEATVSPCAANDDSTTGTTYWSNTAPRRFGPQP